MKKNQRPKERKGSSRSKVVVVSNRLPVTFSKTQDLHHKLTRSSGGLISAIEPLQHAYALTWIGSLGPGVSRSQSEIKAFNKDKKVSYVNVDLDRREWQGYYNGFSNKALWPLLHYFTNHCQFDHKQWKIYEEVNQKFADAVIKNSKKENLIWIHDFHLMLVPQMIRKKRPDAKIGFFLHTPFPSSELFRIFPWRHEILEGLLGADLIGFHTYDYLRHFRSSVLRVLGIDSEMTGINYLGRPITLEAIPVGADVHRIANILSQLKVRKNYKKLKESTADIKILLGVDRLDYTKGILDRLRAYEVFLETNPKWRGKVEFFQILVPSRTEVDSYSDLKRDIDAIIGRVNAEYGKPDWTPIRCFYRQLAMEDLVNFYTRADVAVVTPLRDGMNLVAKEYLLAQQAENPGVLILSEFCGAASELSDAIIVNPTNTYQVAQSYKMALEMDSEEKDRRYRYMLKALQVYSAENWGMRFIETMSGAAGSSVHHSPLMDNNYRKKIVGKWSRSKKRLLLLDYDGTLTDIVSLPKFAKPSSDILRMLKKLSSDPKNLVMIVSGRPKSTLEKWFGNVGIHLCGEHGAWVWDTKEWSKTYINRHPHWKDQVRSVMKTYTARTAGSFIEEKEEALAWHYRLSEPDYGAWQANNLAFNLESLLHRLPLQCLMGKKVVEVRHKDVNKGAAWRWLKKNKLSFDDIMCFGDDKTDEDLFTELPSDAISVHVGTSDTSAKYRIPTPAQVRNLLKSLS